MILEAFLRHAQGRYEEEVALYREAQKLSPSSPLYLNNLAWSLGLELGEPEEGLTVIDGLIANPKVGENPQCLDTRGMILVALERYDAALRDLRKIVAAAPGNAVYQYHLARAYLKAGKEEEFRRHRDLARDAGLEPELLEPRERDEMQELMTR